MKLGLSSGRAQSEVPVQQDRRLATSQDATLECPTRMVLVIDRDGKTPEPFLARIKLF